MSELTHSPFDTREQHKQSDYVLVPREARYYCSGCGTTDSLEEIKRTHPNALSCCPERKMVINPPAHCDDLLNAMEECEAALRDLLDNKAVTYAVRAQQARDALARLSSLREKPKA